VQSGLYLDFFLKKVVEIFIRYCLIYGAQFFGEKYMVEHFTKKIVEYALFKLNQFFAVGVLSYFYYFIQLVGTFIYILVLLNLLLII
jgi:hypothetical protein